MKLACISPEVLEPRIAPAAVFTYTDIDGDTVRITTSKGTNADLAAAGVLTFSDVDPANPRQLQIIDLSLNPAFAGTDLTVTAKRGPSGDGLANVGAIDASSVTGGGGTDLDLGKITIKGDLGQLNAGNADASPASPAVKLLNVRSMGVFGLSTQGGGDLTSDIQGSITKLKVTGDLRDVYLHLTGGPAGNEARFGSVTIGGSLIGGAADNSGKLQSIGQAGAIKIGGSIIGGAGERSGSLELGRGATSLKIGGDLVGGVGFASGSTFGELGAVKIGGSLVGSEADYSASITSGGHMGPITIGGSLLGGDGQQSATIANGGRIGVVKIGGNISGGDGNYSGSLSAGLSITSVTIDGSVIGGTQSYSGSVRASQEIGPVKIGGDLLGGSIRGTALGVDGAGLIYGGRIKSVAIGGSVIAGIDESTNGNLTNNASIRADHDIGAITIKGSVLGNESADGNTFPTIAARGQQSLAPGATSDVAIKSLSIGGNVQLAKVLGGFDLFDPDSAGSNGNASIGTVKVGGNWYMSSISAGVEDVSSNGFGNNDDAVINIPPGAATDGIVARIASITIKGSVIGAPNPFFQTAFTAQQIGSVKIGAYIAPLTPGTDAPIVLTPYTFNVTIREI